MDDKAKRTKLPFNLDAIEDFKAAQSGDTIQLSFAVSSSLNAQTGSVQKSGTVLSSLFCANI